MRLANRAAWSIGIGVALLWAGSAWSGPVTDTWSDPAGDILLDLSNAPSSYGYQHDITDDGFSLGDTITSATLSVKVSDSGGSETYQYEIGLGPDQTTVFSNVPNERLDVVVLEALSLADLQLDGTINVVIRINDENSANQEGLYFVSSSLTAQVTPKGTTAAALPVPGTLALVAFGVAGLGWRRRRRL
jgi:hypothetical protein